MTKISIDLIVDYLIEEVVYYDQLLKIKTNLMIFMFFQSPNTFTLYLYDIIKFIKLNQHNIKFVAHLEL